MLVITDRLSKWPFFIPVPSLDGPTLAQKFIEHYLGHHGLPSAIVSDRGKQFVKGVWAHLCRLLKVKQRLSTAYHPETDGSTERMNQVIEEYIRHFATYNQDNWDTLAPIAQIAIASRDAASTGMSPFFMTHGYHPRLGESVELPEPLSMIGTPRSPVEAAQRVIQKIKDCSELAQSTMAYAQQRQQEIHDKKRDPSESYQVGDKVWLDMRNIKVDPARKKKLSELHQQYTITDVIGHSACRLNIEGIHNVFPVSLLRPVAKDPLPSQVQDDVQPAPIEVDGEDEYYDVDEVLDTRVRKGHGRNGQLYREFLVKWTGYATPTWNKAEDMGNCIALRDYEAKVGKDFATEPLILTSIPKRRGRRVL